MPNPSLRGRVVVKFPAQVIAGDGMVITKSGAAYTFSTTGAGGGVPEAPLDGQQYGRQNQSWTVITGGGGGGTGDFVLKAGDTMTGALKINMPSPFLELDKTVDNQSAYVRGSKGGVARWQLSLGDVSQETGGNAGSDFRLQAYSDAGAILSIPFWIERKTGKVTVSGPPAPGQPLMSINKLASGQSSSIRGETNGSPRWQMSLGDQSAESTGDFGSDFRLQCYSSTGSIIAVPLYIERRTGKVTISGTPAANQPILAINKTAQGMPCAIQGQTNTAPRWQMSLGDSTVESGGNTGSDFRLQAYGDNGAITTIPFYIRRSDGKVTISSATPAGSPMLELNRIGTAHSIVSGANNGSLRWHMAMGDSDPESGSNAGSNFRLHRYADNGAGLAPAMYIKRDSGAFYVFGDALKPGGGIWSDSSDSRIKTILSEYTKGLAQIQTLTTQVYSYLGNDIPPWATANPPGSPDPSSPHYAAAVAGTQFVGLVAQEVEAEFPEMVTEVAAIIDGVAVNDCRMLDTSSLIFALVNAVKELATRVEALENP